MKVGEVGDDMPAAPLGGLDQVNHESNHESVNHDHESINEVVWGGRGLGRGLGLPFLGLGLQPCLSESITSKIGDELPFT